MSSERAAAYLKDLYAVYGDWSLAIAAYNCGPGNVNKAIRRAGADAKDLDFWSIYNYLSGDKGIRADVYRHELRDGVLSQA